MGRDKRSARGRHRACQAVWFPGGGLGEGCVQETAGVRHLKMMERGGSGSCSQEGEREEKLEHEEEANTKRRKGKRKQGEELSYPPKGQNGDNGFIPHFIQRHVGGGGKTEGGPPCLNPLAPGADGMPSSEAQGGWHLREEAAWALNKGRAWA